MCELVHDSSRCDTSDTSDSCDTCDTCDTCDACDLRNASVDDEVI